MARAGWVARHVLLLLAVTLATGWLPGLWKVIAFATVLFALGLARPYLRRLARQVRDIPPVRAAVTWLITEKKEVE